MVPIAIDIVTVELTGKPSPVPELKERSIPYYGIKEAVFPFNMFPEVDPILGPEMRSTGEVLGIADSTGLAYYKAQEAAKSTLPLEGTVLISFNKSDKPEVVDIARSFHEAGFNIMATKGNYDRITEAGIPAQHVKKLHEGRPNIIDHMTNGEIQLVVNSPIGKDSKHDDSYLRKAAVKNRITYLTTAAAARSAAEGIAYIKKNGLGEVKSLQDWHKLIK